MKIRTRTDTRGAAFLLAAALGTALVALPADAQVLKEGTTADGRRYVAGGVGVEEVEELRRQAPDFSLQLITAAPSGAYLAGTQVRITDAREAVVLETTIDAPWLLVDLPGGRYTVRARHQSGSQVERRLTIAPGKPQRVVLHFNAPVDQEPAEVFLEPPRPPRSTQ